MNSARRRTLKQWVKRKIASGARTWASLYQGRLSPNEGGVFPAEWARYSTPLWQAQPDGAHLVAGIGRENHELVQSWDLRVQGHQEQ